VDNGADAVGVVAAEQPDLLLVEDRLPMVSGEQVIAGVRTFSPNTLIAAQVAYSDRVGALLDAERQACSPVKSHRTTSPTHSCT
jgi:CheY-like chemotaxis protein